MRGEDKSLEKGIIEKEEDRKQRGSTMSLHGHRGLKLEDIIRKVDCSKCMENDAS